MVLVGKPEGRRPLGRPKRRREDNIKMDLQEVGQGDMDWVDLVVGFHKMWWGVLDQLRTCQLLAKNSAAGSQLFSQLIGWLVTDD